MWADSSGGCSGAGAGSGWGGTGSGGAGSGSGAAAGQAALDRIAAMAAADLLAASVERVAADTELFIFIMILLGIFVLEIILGPLEAQAVGHVQAVDAGALKSAPAAKPKAAKPTNTDMEQISLM